MEIGLGSLVVNCDGLVMVVAATAWDEVYCVSVDEPKTVKQWRHRSTVKSIERSPVTVSFA